MPDDPVTDLTADRLRVVLAGHRGDAGTARRALGHPDARVREVALGALARTGALTPEDLIAAMGDGVDGVRRRACDLAAAMRPTPALEAALRRALADRDPLVVEAACWSFGEWRAPDAVTDLSAVARSHDDPRAREAAIAALGSIADPGGLPAVLDALKDRPSVRRRAVVALAAFEGEEVADALRRSATDRDWQVREVAEILLEEEGEEELEGGAEPREGL